MKSISSKFFSHKIRLTDERWFHISESHPELKPYYDQVLRVIEDPDEVYYSENSSFYIFNAKLKEFIAENLILYIKKTNGDAFVISGHPISNKRLFRSVGKWKLVKK